MAVKFFSFQLVPEGLTTLKYWDFKLSREKGGRVKKNSELRMKEKRFLNSTDYILHSKFYILSRHRRVNPPRRVNFCFGVWPKHDSQLF